MTSTSLRGSVMEVASEIGSSSSSSSAQAQWIDMNEPLSSVQNKKKSAIKKPISKKGTAAARRRSAAIREVLSKNDPRTKEFPEGAPIKVGKKTYYWENQILGHGTSSTVYRGFFENETVKVAIKVMQRENIKFYLKEQEALQALIGRQHAENLVRYYISEETAQTLYLVIELADITLDNYIFGKLSKNNPEEPPPTDLELLTYIHHACKGLKSMHCGKRGNPIVHRDIKPSNILLSFPVDGKRIAKLSDFGISKILKNLREAGTTNAAGTQEWMSPSCLNAWVRIRATEEGERTDLFDFEISQTQLNLDIDYITVIYKATCADDVFSLGMVIFFVITRGKHPFGNGFNRLNRLPNIRDGKHHLSALLCRDKFLYYNLVYCMIQADPDNRPDIESVLKHPVFWDGKTQLDFVQDASNYLAKTAGHNALDSLRNIIQAYMKTVCSCGGGWTTHLCQDVKAFIVVQKQSKVNSKKYNTTSSQSLLEFIRDKWQHRAEWSQQLRQDSVFGTSKESYISYFTQRFPMFLPVLYMILDSVLLPDKYFPDESINGYFSNKKYRFSRRLEFLKFIGECPCSI